MNLSIYTVCQQALGAVATAVYQGVVVALLAALAMRSLKWANAATRHALWFAILLVIAALVPAHLWMALQSKSDALPREQVAHQELATVPTPQFVAPAVADSSWNVAKGEPGFDFGQLSAAPASEMNLPDRKLPEQIALEAASQTATAPETSGSQVKVAAPAARTPRWRSLTNSARLLVAKIPTEVKLPRRVAVGLIGAWVMLGGVRFAKILARLAEIRHAKTSSAPPSPDLQQLFNRLSAALRPQRPIRLRISNLDQTPMALGFVHPVVLLPGEMDHRDEGSGDVEVEHVLRHELAHLERRDDWINLAQHIIEAALFFHPAVWWISPRLSLEREIACDDRVLEGSGQAQSYALTLANAAGRMAFRRPWLAPGVSGNGSQLQQRISMILDTHRDRSSRLAKRWLGVFTTAAAALAALAIVAGPRLVLAQPDAPPAPPPSLRAQNVADGAPVALPGANAAETGPRSKPDVETDVAVATTPPPPRAEAPEPPEPPVAPEPEVTAVAPTITAIHPMPQIALVTAPENDDADDQDKPDEQPKWEKGHKVRHDNKDMSVEDRLNRIERILDQLQRRDVKIYRYDGPGKGVTADISVQPKVAFNYDWAAAQANRAADQAKRTAEISQRAVDQAMREMDKAQNQDTLAWQKEKADGAAREVEALRQARDSLQAQVRSLDEQLKRLEEQREHLKEQLDDKFVPGDAPRK